MYQILFPGEDYSCSNFLCHSHPPGNQMKPMDCYEDGQVHIFSEEEFQQLSRETESVYKRILKVNTFVLHCLAQKGQRFGP